MAGKLDRKAHTYVLAFESTHVALAAQSALGDIVLAVMPVPREIRAGCGMALKFNASDDLQARGYVDEALSPQDRALSFLYEKVSDLASSDDMRFRLVI